MTFILFGCIRFPSDRVNMSLLGTSTDHTSGYAYVCTVGSKYESTSENVSILHFSNIVHDQNNNLSG